MQVLVSRNFFLLAHSSFDNCTDAHTVCQIYAKIDRSFHGYFDPIDISKDKWEDMTAANNWNSVELRDNRYNHIVHMVSAAEGAEVFYSTEVSLAFFISTVIILHCLD